MQYYKKKYLVIVTLPFQVLIIQFLSQKPQWVELYYSNGLYIFIANFFRYVLGWIPFSVGDVLGIFLLILFIKAIYNLTTNKFKNILTQLLNLTTLLSLIYFCFYAFWGLNYFREPLAKNLSLQQATYTTKQLTKTTEKIIFELNKIHLQITNNDTIKVNIPYTHKQIYNLAANGYNNLATTYPQLAYKNASIKNSLVSLFQSYTGTAGYINPITGEAQVNNKIPKTTYPATTCHEIAHQIGWAAENEANFVGFLAAISNNNVYFKYSGYRMAYKYCIAEIYKRDKNLANKLKNTVHKGIYKDYKESYLHWKKFKNPIEPYLKMGYNSYLKANNQSKGIKSYSYVVNLLISYFDQKK
ncbi:DUF3810 domain-containing protein [Tenacibaculum aestuariivivum]|uniref:DUF3810 domain-containing protein n=1 Tax=Tenacibaculum aestuariivivum TaxID=2006131 RepID=UPI003AB6FFAE